MKYHKTLVEELSETLAKEIQQEIDNNIMLEILLDMGWTKVQYESKDDYEEAAIIGNWLSDNCNEVYYRLNDCYVFEDPKDAEWFILKFT